MQKQLWEDSCEEIDADDLFDMAGVQTLAARAFFSDGEVLVRRQLRSPREGLAVPMQIRLLEGDLLPMEKNEIMPGGGEIVNGVEFNTDGRRVAYHLLQRHPGEYALQQLREHGALPLIDAGRFREAVAKVSNVWASLPGAGYGQHENDIEKLLAAYRAAGGEVIA